MEILKDLLRSGGKKYHSPNIIWVSGESYFQAARSRVDQLKVDIQVSIYLISSEIRSKVGSQKNTVKLIWECQHLEASLKSLATRRAARHREAEVS